VKERWGMKREKEERIEKEINKDKMRETKKSREQKEDGSEEEINKKKWE
jgi:hypothetical protein